MARYGSFGAFLRAKRIERGFHTQATFAEAVAVELRRRSPGLKRRKLVSVNTVSRWETDEDVPTARYFRAIAAVLHLDDGEQVEANGLVLSAPAAGEAA